MTDNRAKMLVRRPVLIVRMINLLIIVFDDLNPVRER